MRRTLEEWRCSTSMSSALLFLQRVLSWERENCYSLWYLSTFVLVVGIQSVQKRFPLVVPSLWTFGTKYFKPSESPNELFEMPALWDWKKNWLPSSILPNHSHMRKFYQNTADVIILALYRELEINFFWPLHHNSWLIFLCCFLPRLLYKCLHIQSGTAVCSPFMILL